MLNKNAYFMEDNYFFLEKLEGWDYFIFLQFFRTISIKKDRCVLLIASAFSL